MADLLSLYLYFFLMYAAFVSITAVFFFDFARVSKKKYLFWTLICLLYTSAIRTVSAQMPSELYLIASIISLVNTIITAIFALKLLVNVSGSMLFYALAITFEHACFMTGNTELVNRYLGNVKYMEWIYAARLLFFSLLICVVVYKFIVPLYHKWKERRTWILLSISPLLGGAGYYVIAHFEADSSFFTINSYLGLWLIYAGLMVANAVCAVSVTHSIQATEYNRKLKAITKLLDLQKEQYCQMADLMNQTSELRHNFHHQANAMSELLQTGQIDELRTFLSRYAEEIPGKKIFTGNAVADAVFGHYLALAKRDSIKVSYQITLPAVSDIEDTDFSVLIGNCMENAIEASLKLPKEKRELRIRTRLKGSFLMLVFENCYNGNVIEREGQFYSSKRDYKEEGVGIICVKRIVELYGGEIAIDYDEERFWVKISLKFLDSV